MTPDAVPQRSSYAIWGLRIQGHNNSGDKATRMTVDRSLPSPRGDFDKGGRGCLLTWEIEPGHR